MRNSIEDIENMIIGEEIGDNIEKLDSFHKYITKNHDVLRDWDNFRVYENKYFTIKKKLHDILAYSIDPEGGKKYVEPIENEVQNILHTYRPAAFLPLSYRERSGCDTLSNDKEIGRLLLDIDEKRAYRLYKTNRALSRADFKSFICCVHELYCSEFIRILNDCENIINEDGYTTIDLDAITIFESLYEKMLDSHRNYVISRIKKCTKTIQGVILKINNNTGKNYNKLVLSLASLVDFFESTIEHLYPDKDYNSNLSTYSKDFLSAKVEFYEVLKKYENL